MGLIAKSYDLSKVVLTVGGIPIGGFGNDGGVEVTWDAPIHEVNVGADGLTVASKVNNTDAIAAITLNQMSRGYLLLAGVLKAQEFNPAPVLLPVPFLLIDPASGDTISSASAIFTDRPTITMNRVSGERLFNLHLPGAAISAIYGAANVV